jgi:predicted RNA-binding protein with PIN domain
VLYETPLDASAVLKALRLLEEEDPSLHVYWQEQIREIHIQLMGEIQLEILKSIVLDRFDMELDFETGNIVYKETIKNTVIGVGHFEPLRHYGEVHLLLEPAPAGSGISISSALGTDELELPYQKQILNSLEKKVHLGVLKGAPLTDVKMTLVAGRAHLKHTEGGDLTEAAWRAVRNGLMYAVNVLLEPYYSFRMELSMELVGRAMSDLQRLSAHVSGPEIEDGTAVLTGQAPVVTLHDYQKEFLIYTSGRGKLTMQFAGYGPCHNSEEVLAANTYDPEADLANTPDSVFCSHGAGFVVPWYEVQSYAHVQAANYGHLYHTGVTQEEEQETARKPSVESAYDPEELDAIFLRTYGVSKREKNRFANRPKEITAPAKPALKDYEPRPPKKLKEELLIVDGFNIIFDWPELRELMNINLDGAIGRLVDILTNYHGYTRRKLLVVFDAYKVRGRKATRFVKEEPIQVIFTGEGETADMYIERFAHENGQSYRVTVATSDGLEQLHVMSQGAVRMSARELYEEVARVEQQIREHIE